MENKKNILNRILLNMKYDSRKTLSENKKILTENITDLGGDGLELTLPDRAKITARYNCDSYKSHYSNNIELIKKDFPFGKGCELQFKEQKEIDNCHLNHFNGFLSNCKNNSVRSFEVDGITYRGCFLRKRFEKYVEPNEHIFTGYYAQSLDSDSLNTTGCKGKKWTGDTETSEDSKNKNIPYNTNQLLPGDPNQTTYDGRANVSLDFD
jgi:hypothetical protein